MVLTNEIIERGIIGTLLTHGDKVDPTILHATDFVKSDYRIIFEACYHLWQENKLTDTTAVISYLQDKGLVYNAGGVQNIVLLAKECYDNSKAFNAAAKMLHEMAIRREAKQVLEEAAAELANTSKSSVEIVTTAQERAYDLFLRLQRNEIHERDTVIEDTFTSILTPQNVSVISSGFHELDRCIGGFKVGEFIIVGGRPGMGKTAMTLSQSIKLAMNNQPVVYFSLDMGVRQFFTRIVSNLTKIDLGIVDKGGPFSDQERLEIEGAKLVYKSMPHFVETNPYLTLADIRSKIRQLKARKDVRVIFIDHVGKVTPAKSHSREREVSQIAEGLKAMTKEFDITIVGLSQLNRDVERRGADGRRPVLADLRESGSLEQEADVVLFPYRPEYYDELVCYDGITPSAGTIEVHVAKNRQGSTGAFLLDFIGQQTLVQSRMTAVPQSYMPEQTIIDM